SNQCHDNHRHSHSHSSHNHHNHCHYGVHHHHVPVDGNRTGLIIALVITAGIMVLEFVGGLLTNSLALLSDSGHMLSDSSSLLFSLIAFSLAAKDRKSTRLNSSHVKISYAVFC